MKQTLLAMLAVSILFLTADAQTNYTVTYTPGGGNPGGLNTGNDNDLSGWNTIISGSVATNQWSLPVTLPFTFNFYGNPVTDFKASANGLVTFATGTSVLPNNNTNLPSAVLPDSSIACYWDAFTSAPPTAAGAIVAWRVFGTAPDRQLWIKWASYGIGAPAVTNANFACMVEETTNNIYLVDGSFSISLTTPATTVTTGIQLDQATAKQYDNQYRQRLANGATATDNNYITFVPYTLTNMTFVASTTNQPVVSNIAKNTINEAVLRIDVETSGELNPLNLTQLDLTPGTTNSADITNAKVFYTGSDSNFHTVQQFGSTITSITGAYAVTGTQQLLPGKNYFWLAYSVPASATAANIIDAECNTITVTSGAYTPTVTAPAGSRTVTDGLSGPINVGAGETYVYLSDAINAINTNGMSGNVTLSITSDIDDVAGSVLTHVSSSNYSLHIVPSADVVRNIRGRFATPLVQFNGSQQVVIDGKGPVSGTGKYLRFINMDTTASTFLFLNGARFDTITNTIIEGTCATDLKGVVTIGTSSASTGNRDLVFTNNDVRDRSDSLGIPAVLFYSAGSAGLLNSNITISNSNLFNFRKNGIYVHTSGNGGNWTFSDNSFYYNASTFPASTEVGSIVFLPGNASDNNQILNNHIGGQLPLCGGSAWTGPNNVNWGGMNISSGIAVGTSIQGNVIQNINITSSSTSTDFAGINITSGRVEVGNITGNLIGHPSIPNSITNNMRLSLCVYGYTATVGEVIIANNTIANITGTGIGAGGVRAISFARGALIPNIYNNTIHDLTSAGTSVGPQTGALLGIALNGGEVGGTAYIGRNKIYNLTSTAVTANIVPSGIVVDNAGQNGVVEKNIIYNLTAVSSGATASIHGIYITGGARNWTFSNNMIALTNGTNTSPMVIRGISDNGSGNIASYFYNTVYIGGNAFTGTLNSFAFERRNANGIPTLRNNIFYNGRSGGFGVHAAIGNVPSVPATNWTANTSGYNLLVADTPFAIGAWGSGFSLNTFSSWQTISNGDYTSWSDTAGALPANLFFKDVANGDLSIDSSNALCWYANGKGIALSGMSDDIHFQPRSVLITTGGTDLGADQFPSTTQPVSAYVSGNILPGDSSTFSFAGRTLAKVFWNSGALPVTVDSKYYSGEEPPSTGQTGALFNSYTNIVATGGGLFDCDVKLFYDSALFGTVSNASNIVNAQVNSLGSLWHANATLVNQTEKTFRTNGLASLDFFTGTDVLNPIPVKLLNFSAMLSKENVDLYWNTASEINSKGFIVERSKDNLTWEEIGFVKGAGNSNKVSNYTLIDPSPFRSGISVLYYRLKMVDNDEHFEYSKTAIVQLIQPTAIKAELYPNPAAGEAQLLITATKEHTASITVADLQGKIISEESIQLQPGINTYPVISITRPGIYFIRVNANGDTWNSKLIKQ